jgi:hypothetical protein
VLRILGRWTLRVVVALTAALVVVYLGDWMVYKLRGSPRSAVTVHRTMLIPLKGNKQEYDDMGTFDVPCSRSLFPQGGQDPCWEVRRNTNQTVQM